MPPDKLIGIGRGLVAAADLPESRAALDQLHNAMERDLGRMKNFCHANPRAKLACLSDCYISGGRFVVPVRDCSLIDCKVVSVEANRYGIEAAIIEKELRFSVMLPTETWDDYWHFIKRSIVIFILCAIAFFIMRPHYFGQLIEYVLPRK